MKRLFRIIVPAGIVLLACILLLALPIHAAETTVLDGKIKLSDTLGNISGASTVTATATGAKRYGEQTNTITLTNNTDSTANISFSWSAKKSNDWFGSISCIVDGVDATSGTFSKNLEKGASINITLKAQGSYSQAITATLTLSNFSYTAVAATQAVVLNSIGDGTITLDGTAITSGASYDISPIAGATLVASPSSSATFLGWIDTQNNILSTSLTYSIYPNGNMTVQAVFVNTSSDAAWFIVDNAYLTNNLNTASSLGTMIVLANNGTISAGTYTISSGDTLLIPYDATNSFRGTPTEHSLVGFMGIGNDGSKSPNGDTHIIPYKSRSTTTNELYRTLNLAANVTLIVNGNLEVGGQTDPFGAGQRGKYALIQMGSGSKITVNSGGVLYAWGYIKGSGTVEAYSGAKVYEHLDCTDYPNAGNMMDLTDLGAFAIREFTMNGIEVNCTINFGATYNVYLCVYGTSVGYNAFVKPLINSTSDAVFQLTSGKIIKSYVSSRQKMEFDGQANINPFKLTVSSYTMDSAKTSGFAIPKNWDIRMTGGTVTANESVLLLAGSTVTVNSGASIVISSGKNVFLFDATEDPSSVTTDAKLDVNGTITVNGGFYTTASGAQVISSGGTGTVVCNAVGEATSVKVRLEQNTVKECDITPAQLKNAAAGSYTPTTEGGTYKYVNGVWTNNDCSVNGHDKSDPVRENEVAATCAKEGSYDSVVYCSVCREELSRETVTTEKAAHTPGAAANCTTAQTCTVCSAEIKPATGHTEVIDAAVAVTCTSDGKTEGKHCSVCKVVLVAQETITSNGHTEVIDKAVAATCTTDGKTEGKHCSVCNEVLVAQETVASSGHTTVVDAAVAATCTKTGLTEGSHCSVCGEVLVAQEEVPMIEHTPGEAVVENATDATCGAAGSYEEVVYCSGCGKELSREDKTVDALPHSPAAAVRENEIAATCHSEGSYDEVVYCSVCKKEISRTPQTIEKSEHIPAEAVREKEVEATCYSKGSYDEVVYCSVEECKTELSRTEKSIEKIAHTPAEAVRENEVDATCYSDGSYDEVVYCSVEACKAQISRTSRTADKIAHTPAEAVREHEVGATCYSKGSYDEVVYCSVEECKAQISRSSKTIEKISHTPGEVVYENVKAETCYSEGSWDEVVYCTVAECKAELSRTQKYAEKTKHTPAAAVRENVVDSTCTAEGSYDQVVYCVIEACHEELERTAKTIEKKEHTKGDEIRESVIDATCGAPGSYTSVYKCTVCGQEASRTPNVVIPATGEHNYSSEIERAPATCTEDGYYTEKCGTCGDEKTTPLIATGHNYEYSVVKTPPTCEQDGYFTYTCVCGDAKVIPDTENRATGHKDENGDNICDIDTCKDIICDHTWTVTFKWSEDFLTCTAIGTASCKKAEHNKSDVATLDNLRLLTEVTQEPTCTTSGTARYTAVFTESWIGLEEGQEFIEVEKDDVVIPATGHSTTLNEHNEATCTEPGNVAYWHCSVCEKNFEDQAGVTEITNVVISATGHSYTSEVTAPTCAKDGFTTYTCACGDAYTGDEVPSTGAHDYSVINWDRREKWSECSVCKDRTNVEARTYNITIVDYWNNTTVRREYTYGKYLWLNYSTSNVLELNHLGWQVGDQVVPAHLVWESFDIDENTKELTVTEFTQAGNVKPGAIMMAVNYNPTEQGKTMTVDLFIYVDSMDEKYKPIVMLDGRAIDENDVEIIDPSLMMYFVSIELSADQLKQGGTNAQITVDYDRNGTADKTINSVVLAYQTALETYLQNLGSDNIGEEYAGALQQNAIDCVVDYGKAVQYVFGNPEGLEFGGYKEADILAYAEQAPLSIQKDDNTINGITFKWEPASVNFESEYSIRYKFTLVGADGYTPTVAHLIVRNSEGKEIGNYDNLTVSTVDGQYAVMYPVPASDLSEANTTVQITVTLSDGAGNTTSAQSSEIKYGIHAYLTRELYRHTKGSDCFDFEGVDKTEEYVDMLVSLIRLGESVDEIEKMTSNKNSNE